MNNFFTITKQMFRISKLLVVTLCVPLLYLSALSASAQAPEAEVLSADHYNATVTQLNPATAPMPPIWRSHCRGWGGRWPNRAITSGPVRPISVRFT